MGGEGSGNDVIIKPVCFRFHLIGEILRLLCECCHFQIWKVGRKKVSYLVFLSFSLCYGVVRFQREMKKNVNEKRCGILLTLDAGALQHCHDNQGWNYLEA